MTVQFVQFHAFVLYASHGFHASPLLVSDSTPAISSHLLPAVDLTQGQTPLPRTEPPVPGDHDLAATLKALAANSSSFGGNQAGQTGSLDPNDVDPEMLARSAECQLHH